MAKRRTSARTRTSTLLEMWNKPRAAATKLRSYTRRNGEARDPLLRAGGIDEHALGLIPKAILRAKLRRALTRQRPDNEFFLAAFHPAIRDLAVRGALASLARGDVAWSFILHENWGISPRRGRPAVLAAARRASPPTWPELTRALARVGGREARVMVERAFLDVKSRPGPAHRSRRTSSGRDFERLYDAAAALVRLSPRRIDAGELLVAGLRHEDLLARGAAARAVAFAQSRRRGAGLDMLRAALRSSLLHPDGEIFFVVEKWLSALSRLAFLRGCERLLGTEVRDIAADRLIRLGGRAQRAKVLAELRRRNDFSLHVTAASALGKRAPRDVLLRVLRRGLARPSPFERHRTIWLLEDTWRTDFASLARRALSQEPDPGLRARLRALLEREV